MSKLHLIRGVPGSGKSTRAKSLVGYVNCETDQFFVQDGVYIFDGSKLKENHQKCLRETKNALIDGRDVVVSNTFTTTWEIQAYYNLSVELGVEFSMETCSGNYQNVHGVPDEKITQMKARFVPDDVVWKDLKCREL